MPPPPPPPQVATAGECGRSVASSTKRAIGRRMGNSGESPADLRLTGQRIRALGVDAELAHGQRSDVA